MEWPEKLKVGPLREWPGEMTLERRRSPFEATLSSTLETLERELRMLGSKAARTAEMLIALDVSQFRVDGRPYANAQPAHPGIVLSFEHHQHGSLSYPSDRFTTWQDNLRAVALALEALRKVDRYGVTRHGEQYRGFRAIEGTSSPGFPSSLEAVDWLQQYEGLLVEAAGGYGALLRRAQRRAHPDRGGSSADWLKVSQAETTLRKAGLV